MAMARRARKTVRLQRSGGSRSVTLPKAWLERLGAVDEVDIVETEAGILIQAASQEGTSIEDEPEFARFLAFLMKDSLQHPERLGDVGELADGDDDLFRDVKVD